MTRKVDQTTSNVFSDRLVSLNRRHFGEKAEAAQAPSLDRYGRSDNQK